MYWVVVFTSTQTVRCETIGQNRQRSVFLYLPGLTLEVTLTFLSLLLLLLLLLLGLSSEAGGQVHARSSWGGGDGGDCLINTFGNL